MKKTLIAILMSFAASATFAKDPFAHFPVVFGPNLHVDGAIFKYSLEPFAKKGMAYIGIKTHGYIDVPKPSMGTVTIYSHHGLNSYVCENSNKPGVNQIYVDSQHGMLTCKYQIG
jgi:hypothetical protein